MSQPVETIIDSEMPYKGDTIKVKIDHILDWTDDESPYTGKYRVRLGNGERAEIELDDNAIWIEKGKGSTELSREAGKLIENYSE